MSRILILNPSKWGRGITPIWIASHTAILRTHGHDVQLFDCTFFADWTQNENAYNSNYYVSERPIKDPSFDPMPKGLTIRGNEFGPHRLTIPDGGRMNFIIKLLAGLGSQDIIYDGIDDGTYNGSRPAAARARSRIN